MINCRRKSREATIQALYQCDLLNDWSNESLNLYFQQFQPECNNQDGSTQENLEFTKKLITGVIANREFIDLQISISSENWSIGRMAKVDRNILRLATYEVAFCDDIPVSVTINEALEIAKRYCADDAHMFINGVLDKISQKLQPQLANKTGWREIKKDAVNE
jgi:transcription antitermination protein NusB